MKKNLKFINLLFVLNILKVFLFYFFTIKVFNISLIISTIFFIACIYLLINFAYNNKDNKAYILYSSTSIILFIDVLYYKYYSFLPSVIDLSFVSQISTVKKSVYHLVNFSSVFMVIDLLPLYFIKKKQKYNDVNLLDKNIKTKKIVSIILVFFIIFGYIMPKGNEMYVFKNYGIYNYHTYDILSNIQKYFEEEKAIASFGGYENTKEDKGKYFGIAKNKNIIAIQLESFQDFLINKTYNGSEITPNLNKLVNKDSIYFNNYYQQVGRGNTSDSEYIMDNSMHSLGKQSVYQDYQNNYFYSLPKILKKYGYNSLVLHGNDKKFWNREKIYPALGIDKFISLEDFYVDEIISIGLSDESFFRQSIKYLVNQKKPFYSKLITLSSHHPYKIPEELQKLELNENHKNTLFGDYLQSVHYTDKALGEFINDLKINGLYENSIIVLYGDHSGLYISNEETKNIMSEYLGYEYRFDEVLNIPLLFHIPNSDINDTNPIVAGQIDFAPTLLNLLGVLEDSGVFFGQDLNNAVKGFVATQYYVPKGSFIDDEKIFLMSKDGIFENSIAWNLKTKRKINIKDCVEEYNKALKQIGVSNDIIKDDRLKNIFKYNLK